MQRCSKPTQREGAWAKMTRMHTHKPMHTPKNTHTRAEETNNINILARVPFEKWDYSIIFIILLYGTAMNV